MEEELSKKKEEDSKELFIWKQQVESECEALRNQIKLERLALDKQKKAFVGDQKFKTQKKIKLDVGGKIFSTSITTLVSEPDSMLAAMFSGRFELEKDEEGTFFIDRDGKHFGHILNWLRTKQLSSSIKDLDGLKMEADYYGLKGLVNLLSKSAAEDEEKNDKQITQRELLDILKYGEPYKLNGLNLKNLCFHQLPMKHAHMSFCNLQGADFHGADLYNAKFCGANLQDVNFSGANLNLASLNGATLSRANFQKADLRGADLQNAKLDNTIFTGAKCNYYTKGLDEKQQKIMEHYGSH